VTTACCPGSKSRTSQPILAACHVHRTRHRCAAAFTGQKTCGVPNGSEAAQSRLDQNPLSQAEFVASVADSCVHNEMVRRGSTVRVRQRACKIPPKGISRFLVQDQGRLSLRTLRTSVGSARGKFSVIRIAGVPPMMIRYDLVSSGGCVAGWLALSGAIA